MYITIFLTEVKYSILKTLVHIKEQDGNLEGLRDWTRNSCMSESKIEETEKFWLVLEKETF